MTAARIHWWLLAPVTAVGFLLRLPSPDRQLEYDEVISILFAALDPARMVQATAADTMPPLYYFLLHLWAPGGDNLLVARLLSTLLSAASVPVLFLLGQRLEEPREALAAAALLAVSPFHGFYGHYTRMYALLGLLQLLAAYGFVRWLQTGERRALVGFAVAAGLSLWVHNLALLAVLALDLAFLIGIRYWPGDRWTRLRDLLLAHLALLLMFLPWLLVLPQQLQKVASAFWTTSPGLAELIRTPLVFLFHLPLPAGWLGPLALVAGLALAVTVVETRRAWRRDEKARPQLLVLSVLALAPVMVLFLVAQLRPVYVERALLLPSCAYLLLLVRALRRVPVRAVVWVLLPAIGVGTVVAWVYQTNYEEFPRSPFLEADRVLAQQLQPGDVVLHDNKLSFFPMYFFARDLPPFGGLRINQRYLPDPPGSPNDTLAPETTAALGLPPTQLEDAAQDARRVWFVIFREALDEAERAGVPHGHKSWLDQRFRGAPAGTVGDLQFYRYQVER